MLSESVSVCGCMNAVKSIPLAWLHYLGSLTRDLMHCRQRRRLDVHKSIQIATWCAAEQWIAVAGHRAVPP